MASPIARVMSNHIFNVRVKRKSAPAPSEIQTLKGYTARLVDQKWLRLAARRGHA
ncbi:NinE family protein [Leclercia pneumoniae]|uniref:NinE family protein n=1 Tax=Leclercia pneumoniae TaxID=2815358 RepID=UPI0030D4FA49